MRNAAFSLVLLCLVSVGAFAGDCVVGYKNGVPNGFRDSVAAVLSYEIAGVRDPFETK
jgi:hypothetical protein